MKVSRLQLMTQWIQHMHIIWARSEETWETGTRGGLSEEHTPFSMHWIHEKFCTASWNNITRANNSMASHVAFLCYKFYHFSQSLLEVEQRSDERKSYDCAMRLRVCIALIWMFQVPYVSLIKGIASIYFYAHQTNPRELACLFGTRAVTR